MDHAFDALLKSQKGSANKDMASLIIRMMSPKILPMIQQQLSDVIETIDNPKCSEAMFNYVNNIFSKTAQLSTWALRMLDASAKVPQGLLAGGWALLGDYDECVRTEAPAFVGQYCLLTACARGGDDVDAPCVLDPRDTPVWQRFAQGEEAWRPGALDGLPLHLGLCVPSVCGADETRALAERMVAAVAPFAGLRFEMGAGDCRVDGGFEPDIADIFALFLLFVLGLVVGASTAYDYMTRGAQRKRPGLLLAFSALRNFSHLLREDPPAEVGPLSARSDALPAVHGLRVLSLLWVACAHSLVIAARLPLANGQHFLQVLEKPSTALVTAGFLGLDTLFLLSGTLTAYAFLRRAASGKSFSFIAHYLQRLVRYLPSLGIVLFLQSTIFLKLRDGPLWNMTPAQQCSKSWPFILLQICNYFRPETVQCMEQAWFLSAEWQLFALAPLVLLALRRRARHTLATMAALCVAGVALRFWLAYSDGLHAPWGSNYTKEALKTLYYPTHVRFVPYIIGLALGYELHRMKHSETAYHVTKQVALVLQVVWPVLLVWSMVGVHQFGSATYQHSPLMEALFLALVHSTWALGIAIFVYLSATGMPVLGNSFLSLSVWQPLSRLVFGAYLLHEPILEAVTFDARFALNLCIWQQVGAGVMAFAASLLLATALWLALEAPMARLITLLGDPTKDIPKIFGEACGEYRRFILQLFQPLLDPAHDEFKILRRMSADEIITKQNMTVNSYHGDVEKQKPEYNIKQYERKGPFGNGLTASEKNHYIRVFSDNEKV